MMGVKLLGMVGCGVGIGWSVFLLTCIPPAPRPVLGHRGRQRGLAIERNAGFRSIEPIMRIVAGWVARLPSAGWHDPVERRLRQGGEHLGLSAHDFAALCSLGAAVGGLLGLVVARYLQVNGWWMISAVGLGFALPWSRLTQRRKQRREQIERGLPHAIDLAALCMSAGMDFPGALRLLVQDATKDDPLCEELQRVLEELELGSTRSAALQEFAQRVPTRPVREFVTATLQAEEKGTPLAETLQIQARTLRMRRSVASEEAASRAAVLLLAPVAMLMACILVGLLGPFLVTNAGF